MQGDYTKAIQDFHRARLLATIEQATARITGKQTDLLSYDEVLGKLHASNIAYSGIRDIPINQIVGSVGRYTDFSRSFLPKDNSDKDRWANIFVAQNRPEGLDAIEVYKIGDVYFVKDGHHRVSVARQMGASQIEAVVTEVKTKVPLTPDMDFEEIILKAEYSDFLEHIQLDKLRPDADLSVTLPGQYEKLEEHIKVHRYFMGIEQSREIPYQEAVTHWYDTVYKDVENSIDAYQLLKDFPGRTKTDLYLWIMENRTQLEESLGWHISPTQAAAHFSNEFSNRVSIIAARIANYIKDIFLPDSIEPGPPTGQWRSQWLERINYKTVFHNIMVPLSGEDDGWKALEQAIIIAKLENGRIRGLHIVHDEEEANNKNNSDIIGRFNHYIDSAGLEGNLVIEKGTIARKICDRSQWVDLVVANLKYPPKAQLISRLGSGFHIIINRCSRPILAVTSEAYSPQKILLAYDGSPKSREALFLAAYFVEHWQSVLHVLTISVNSKNMEKVLNDVKIYLDERNIEANFILESKIDNYGLSVTDIILKIADDYNCKILLMGGYKANPLFPVSLSSDVDEILRKTKLPVLICR